MGRSFKNNSFVALLIGLVSLATPIVINTYTKKTPSETIAKVSSRHNQNIMSFRTAKKYLKNIYADHQITFYCGCNYSVRGINYKNCPYIPPIGSKRAHRVEWEHLVPAQFFGRNFTAWREGNEECKRKNGKPFKGRKCARKTSADFRKMEADLYNLVPAIGELNRYRGTKGFRKILDETTSSVCSLQIGQSHIEPPDSLKGFIARVYLYMHKSYPNRMKLSSKQKKLYSSWHKESPPSSFELTRGQRIANIQGNKNPYLSQAK